tara:strand:- start:599 stop:1474 length:876 start_codon:yes stop_codon:yes gene_type:complete
MRRFLYDILSYIPQSKNDDNLKVLAYHTVPSVFIFKSQIEYLIEHYNIISIEELALALFEKKNLPENPLLITFDDGDISVFENGYPVLEQFKVPSAMFIITGLIDTQNTFWCRWVEKVFEQQGQSYSLARKQVNYLKSVPEKERLEYLHSLPQVDSVQLTSPEIIQLSQSGMYIGNHTHTHPMINKCTPDQIKGEMYLAKKKFQEMGIPDNYEVFAYPNGNWEPQSENVLKEENIKMAFLFDHQLNKDISKINPMRISRIRVNADDELSEFKVKVSGLHSKILNLRQNIGI